MDGNPPFDADVSNNTPPPPPRYSDHGAGPSSSTSVNNSGPPPYYLEQIRFPVGAMVPTEPFVTIPQLKAHLGLLRAFRELKNRVTDLEINQDVRGKLPSLAQELGQPQRWTWFLELALERYVLCNPWPCLVFSELWLCRFYRWASKLLVLLQPNGSLRNPPLDVWLIWHAHLLNPS